MRLWIAKNSETPVKEQLATQIMLAIVSGDLKVNQKLPSTREVARRLKIHYNTVSGVYRDLAKRGWLELRPGSSFYVRERLIDNDSNDKDLKLDLLINSFLKELRLQGFTVSELQKQLPKWLEMQPPDHFLVIDPSKELRKILATEIRIATSFPVRHISPEECSKTLLLNGSIPVAIYGRVDKSDSKLPANLKLLKSNSVQLGIEKFPSIPKDLSLVVVSYWPEFLRWGKALLTAIGIDSANLSFRDINEKHWEVGITNTKTFVIADVLAAKELPLKCRHLVFNIISDSSLIELKESMLLVEPKISSWE
ncbi:MAG: GntR family transcriptional regulator [Acidobacteria bacterium]|nr:GntR family transcriptional regulator [Acidobacteriota bacterium]